MKKFKDEERPYGKCYDCGLSYRSPCWVDVLVPNKVWELINPTYHEGAGLLCFNCIHGRISEIGLKSVPLKIVSGLFVGNKMISLKPFSHSSWNIAKCELTNDWCLVINRGLSCEDHTQIISYHVTNTPSEDSIFSSILENEVQIEELINGFCDANNIAFDIKINLEQANILFCYELLKFIVSKAEELEGLK